VVAGAVDVVAAPHAVTINAATTTPTVALTDRADVTRRPMDVSSFPVLAGPIAVRSPHSPARPERGTAVQFLRTLERWSAEGQGDRPGGVTTIPQARHVRATGSS
jgi:hypothetical protein